MIIKKIRNIFLKTLLILSALIVVFYLVLSNKKVQTYLSKKLASALSETLNSRVDVSGVNFIPPNNLIAYGVLIEGQKKDTLIYANKIISQIKKWSIQNKVLHLKSTTIEKAKFYLTEDRYDTNLNFLLDSLDSDSPSQLDFKLGKLIFKHSRFKYNYNVNPEKFSGVNFDDIDCTDINFIAKDFYITDDKFKFKIRNLSFKDKSNFKVNKINANGEVYNKKLLLTKVKLKTPNSNINLDTLFFNTNPKIGWQNFVKNQKQIYKFKNSWIGLKDIGYFTHKFTNKEKVFVNGKLKGTVNNFTTKNLSIHYNKSTKAIIDCSISGLPKIDSSYIELNIKKLITNIDDIKSVKINKLKNKYISLPNSFNNLDTLKFKGNFKGSFENFITNGVVESKLGKVKADFTVIPNLDLNRLDYDGNISTKDFYLGKILDNDKDIGNITTNLKLTGFSNNKQPFEGFVYGTIDSLNFFDHNYKNIFINARLNKEFFNGLLSIEDELIKFNIDGKIDFSKPIPEFYFESTIKNAHLKSLNLSKQDNSIFSCNIDAKFNGLHIDNLNGFLNITDIIYKNNYGTSKINKLNLFSKVDSVSNLMTLDSDICQAKIKGKYNLEEVISEFNKVLHRAIPNKISFNKKDSTINSKFKLDLIFKNVKPIAKIVPFNFDITKNSKITAIFNPKDSLIDIKADLKSINYNSFNLENVSIHTGIDSILNFKLRSNKISYGKTKLYNLAIKSKAYNNNLNLKLFWNNWEENTFSGNFDTDVKFLKDKNCADIFINNSNVIISDTIWAINPSIIRIDSSGINIKDFKLFNKNEFISASGKLDYTNKNNLNINFNNIDLSYINYLKIKEDGLIKGRLNGFANLSYLNNTLLLKSNITASNLFFNNEYIGSCILETKWNNIDKELDIQSNINKDGHNYLFLTGNINPITKKVNFDIELDKFQINLLSEFYTGLLYETKGTAYGKIKINGTTNNLQPYGSLRLNNFESKFNFSETKYTSNDTVWINPKNFVFKDFDLYDIENNKLKINGKINHNNLSSIILDLSLKTDKFILIDTKDNDISSYYGKAYIEAVCSVKGNPNNLKIDASAKTLNNSKIFIPIRTDVDNNEKSSILFLNYNTQKRNITEKDFNLQGILMDIDLNVSPETDIKILFDSKLGNISCKGNGDLNLIIDENGEFKIYGDYFINSGNYLFKMQEIINKEFKLGQGSSISWSGSTYDADISIDAIYPLRANIDDLFQESETTYGNVDINCNLILMGNLLNPDIDFAIDVPSGNSTIRNKISSILTTKSEINKQLLSLLVLNRFFPPEYINENNNNNNNNNNPSYGSTTTYELLSAQVSQWMSQFSKDVNIGVKYRPSDGVSEEEFEFALSTQLLNNKLIVNGNVAKRNNFNK